MLAIEPTLWVELLSLAVSVVTLGLLVPLYGKVFFSTHKVEFLPMDEWLDQRKALNLGEPALRDGPEKKGKEDPGFVPPKSESYDELKLWDPKRWSPKKRPSVGPRLGEEGGVE